MGELGNIVIGGESALYLHLHCDGPDSIGAIRSKAKPLANCAATLEGLSAFNADNPLYGGAPVTVLASSKRARRQSQEIVTRCLTCGVPDKSFYQLRDGLFVAGPQLTFALLGFGHPLGKVAEAGMNLCGRYYVHYITGEIRDRHDFAATPRQLRSFLDAVPDMRGARRATEALRWVVPNSGSPLESKMWLQYRLPRSRGGFNLPFDAMNYDVRSGRSAMLTTQDDFSIDMVCTTRGFGLEYDGRDYHEDAAHDKRRRNELAALGWEIAPIDKSTLYDAEQTERAAHQIARRLGVRLQDPSGWERHYCELRQALDLPI